MPNQASAELGEVPNELSVEQLPPKISSFSLTQHQPQHQAHNNNLFTLGVLFPPVFFLFLSLSFIYKIKRAIQVNQSKHSSAASLYSVVAILFFLLTWCVIFIIFSFYMLCKISSHAQPPHKHCNTRLNIVECYTSNSTTIYQNRILFKKY